MIYISQVVIPCEEEIIQFFKDNLFKTYVWDETRVLSMDRGGIGVKTECDTYKSFVTIFHYFVFTNNGRDCVSISKRLTK